MRFVSRVVLPALLFVYIGYETWLKLHHQSLCSATGCRLAGELLRFPSIYLNFLGLFAAVAIGVLGVLSLRKRPFETLYFVALYAALAFETIMISYQILANPEPCLFCLGVYGGLLLIALTSRPAWFLYALPILGAIVFALSDLAIPRNAALIGGDGLYLIASEHCPHCRKVKRYFADHHVRYTLLGVDDPSVRHLAKALGVEEIPILIRRKGDSMRILWGDTPIIASFERSAASNASESNASAAGGKASETDRNLFRPEHQGCSIDELSENPEAGCADNTDEVKLR
ncbi:glutaredoxin family protein [Nitratifractor sp.]